MIYFFLLAAMQIHFVTDAQNIVLAQEKTFIKYVTNLSVLPLHNTFHFLILISPPPSPQQCLGMKTSIHTDMNKKIQCYSFTKLYSLPLFCLFVLNCECVASDLLIQKHNTPNLTVEIHQVKLSPTSCHTSYLRIYSSRHPCKKQI